MPPFVTGDHAADEVRGTTVPVPPAGNPRSQRQLDQPTGEPSLTSPRLERRWIPGRSQANTQCRRARATAPGGPAIAGRGRRNLASREAAWPRIHEGMDWGAVGLVPTAPGKRTRHHLVTPDRPPPPCHLRAPITNANHKPPSPTTLEPPKTPTTPARSTRAPTPLDTQGSFRDGLGSVAAAAAKDFFSCPLTQMKHMYSITE